MTRWLQVGEAEPRFRIAIPARYASTRLPGKPLRLLAGRPLIEHVYRRALGSGAVEVVIATDDPRIRAVAESFGAEVCMTSPDHPTGTDRLAEVATQRGWPDQDIVVNVQGDEPRIPPALVRQVAMGLEEHPAAGIATACTRIREVAEVFDPNAVKVVLDAQGYARYFSRAPIPWHREAFQASRERLTELPEQTAWFRHIGLYAYRVAVLRRYPQLTPAPAEQAESLEQLRALWHGIGVYVAEAAEAPPPGVDTEADLARLAAEWERSG
ncbi:3-deoxy-manno-octulosonate cytidylyltransferase [Candidatus Contendibacter odensensis]|uniref:3-deoxy-manno-octulosonate cytidylyltransferase n=1 Tax=Candidatus Contendibacter odensensis TaxID=1400860 RepID=UPI000686E876|nr:3-deoxy-manno-octulosonate cytidylyltransferase [Candidatus Contendobacter odensis]MBK8752440.1 3-deoxy-manno-octulosonate cytidylyltransferase [Candidatus Competibacteraceae bacterium]